MSYEQKELGLGADPDSGILVEFLPLRDKGHWKILCLTP